MTRRVLLLLALAGAAPATAGAATAPGRLTREGARDTGFGSGGIAVITVGSRDATTSATSTGGYGVGQAASGRLLVLGRRDETPVLAAITAAGALDPTWGSGGSLAVPNGSPLTLLVAPTGRADVIDADRVTRFDPLGRPDASFGESGVVTYRPTPDGSEPQVLPTPEGGLLVASPTPFEVTAASEPTLRVLRVSPTGVRGATTDVRPGFGGGLASFVRSTRLLSGIDQDGFEPGQLVPRPDGTFVLPGGVRIVRYTGEGVGFSTGLVAAAGLRADLTLDPRFGGPQAPARFSTSVPPQRARPAGSLRRVRVRVTAFGPGLALLRVRVTASGPGLALLRVRDGRRRVIAQSLEPIYAAGSTAVSVPLTTVGRRILDRGGLRVTVGHAFKDALAGRATGSRVAALR